MIMTNELEHRQVECTECTHRSAEHGRPILSLRPGDVTIRVCSECGKQTIHVLVQKRLVKNSRRVPA